MRLFKKRKKNIEPNNNAISDKVAGRIAGVGIKIQKTFADFMNTIFSGMPAGKLKIILVIFCICGGGYSIYLIGDTIFGSANKKPILKIDPIEVPRHYNRAGDEMLIPENYVDQETYKQIKDFQRYMDSLKLDKKGRIIYDSILLNRPGLMDSAKLLEEIYLSQQIK